MALPRRVPFDDLATPKVFYVAMRSFVPTLDKLIEIGHESSPRGIPTIETLNASLVIQNPLDRLIPNAGRRLNVAFAFFDWLSTIFGIDETRFFTRFIKDFSKFSTDGQIIDGCYGTRINPPPEWFTINEDPSDLESRGGFLGVKKVIDILKADPDSRRAVFTIYNTYDLDGQGGKNPPCAISMQFILRDGKLHCTVTMRANDAILGTSNDVVTFSMIQEFIARYLDVELGQLTINAGSFHIYKHDLHYVEAMREGPRYPYMMQAMPKMTFEDLEGLAFMSSIYLDPEYHDHFYERIHDPRNVWWSSPEVRKWATEIACTMKCFVHRHDKDGGTKAMQAYSYIQTPVLKHILRHWLKAAKVSSPKFRLAVAKDE